MKVGAQLNEFKAMLRRMDHFLESRESGVHVPCFWIRMENWDQCMGSIARWMPIEVLRTIQRAELTAFLCFLEKVSGPTKVHVDKKGIIDDLWKGEMKCIGPKAEDADLWIKIWEELYSLSSKEILVEVEHVKAHSTEKGRKHMSHFEKFVTEGNEKADELAKEGAMLDGDFTAQARADTIQQEREREREKRCTQPCSTRLAAFTVWWRNGKTVKMSSRSQKKNESSWIRTVRKRSIEWSGVLQPAGIDA